MNDEALTAKARALQKELTRDAEDHGYHMNPDSDMVLMLCEGLQTNIERYGYMGCPCRLLEGDMNKDLDIICPCDYRDPDLDEYGACYCALYVSEEIVAGKKTCQSIPERRPTEEERKANAEKKKAAAASAGPKVWRCQVCGYLAAREHPPERCPICNAQKERFETFSAREPAQHVWRCQVCGYLAARDRPPERCPVCKAQKERFETFAFG